jgi:hypothetical protein
MKKVFLLYYLNLTYFIEENLQSQNFLFNTQIPHFWKKDFKSASSLLERINEVRNSYKGVDFKTKDDRIRILHEIQRCKLIVCLFEELRLIDTEIIQRKRYV